MVADSGATLIMGGNATLQNNYPKDVYSSASRAYCDPEAGNTPFLYCTKSICTEYYVSPSPYLACYWKPSFSGCDNTLYGANFTGFNITSITSSYQLNQLLLDSNANPAPKVISLGPGIYTLSAGYQPVNNICIKVGTL